MWTVGGDPSTHQRFLEALPLSGRTYTGRVEAWYDGQLRGEVEFESGSVQVSARNRERRALDDLVVAESLWPRTPQDLLTSYGGWLKAHVTITAGLTEFRDIPVFAGRIRRPRRTRRSGRMMVSAVDPMWLVNRAHFETVRPLPAGAGIAAVILQLLREVFPEATLEDRIGAAATVPAALVWNAQPGSRGKAVDELAAAVGGEVFARPTAVWPAGDFVLRPIPTLADPVAWFLPTRAETSVLENDELEQSADEVVNRWIVEVQRQDAPPLRVVVSDDDPLSPTRYGGPMGALPDFYSSPLITDETQGVTAGRAKLARTIGLARQRKLRVIANPALDGGDIMALSVDDEPLETLIADDFAIPLTADPAHMDITSRSTGPETA